VTRAGADPLNVRARTGNLELRRGFFSNRVAQDWNNVPSDIKNIIVTGKFRTAYRKLQEAAPMITCDATTVDKGKPISSRSH
jgi:hypothetical protein